MGNPQDDGNGRVTLARIDERLTALTDDVKRVETKVDRFVDRVTDVEKVQEGQKSDISNWAKAQSALTVICSAIAVGISTALKGSNP